MSVAIVVLDSLAVTFIYEGAEPRQDLWSGEWGSPEIALHIAVPEGLDPQCIMAVRADDGTITLQEDPVKLEARTAQAWRDLRLKRNQLLAASDWTQLQDAHLSLEKKQAWADYRQALRDLPEEVTSPTDLVPWPADPTVVVQAPVTGSRVDNLLSQV